MKLLNPLYLIAGIFLHTVLAAQSSLPKQSQATPANQKFEQRVFDPATQRFVKPVPLKLLVLSKSTPRKLGRMLRSTPGAGQRIGYTTSNTVRHDRTLVELPLPSQDLLDEGHTLVGIDSLNPGDLDGIDRLVVGLVDHRDSLSSEQMDVIEDFVLDGGRLVFLGENPSFLPNNITVGGRFGIRYPLLTSEGSVRVDTTGSLPHPITDGPFGKVSFIDGQINNVGAFGTMLDTGPYGKSIIDLEANFSCAMVIEAGALAPGSGTVIALSEINIFSQDYLRGDNRILWKNLFAYTDLTTLDFETEDDFTSSLSNGQAITSPGAFGRLVRISSSGPGTFGAAIFDSNPIGPNLLSSDPDLLVNTGNILIVQENGIQTTPGVFDLPDDSARGGTLAFDFPKPVQLFSVDLIDICPGPNRQDATVTLFDASGARRSYFVPTGWTSDVDVNGGQGFRTLDLLETLPQQGFQSVATSLSSTNYETTQVVRMTVQFASSGALDNLRFVNFD